MDTVTLCLMSQANGENTWCPLKNYSYSIPSGYGKPRADLLNQVYVDIRDEVCDLGGDVCIMIVIIIPITLARDEKIYCSVIKAWIDSIDFFGRYIEIVLVDF